MLREQVVAWSLFVNQPPLERPRCVVASDLLPVIVVDRDWLRRNTPTYLEFLIRREAACEAHPRGPDSRHFASVLRAWARVFKSLDFSP